jgi:hypothetical protein
MHMGHCSNDTDGEVLGENHVPVPFYFVHNTCYSARGGGGDFSRGNTMQNVLQACKKNLCKQHLYEC